MMMPSWPATAALGLALCLAGCSGTSSPPTAGASSVPTTPTPSGSSATPAAPTPAPSTTGSETAISAADVCPYLAGRLPTLRTIGSAVGVQANLAGNLETFFEAHGTHADGQVLEDATSSGCPAVRTEVLRLAGIGSFNEL